MYNSNINEFASVMWARMPEKTCFNTFQYIWSSWWSKTNCLRSQDEYLFHIPWANNVYVLCCESPTSTSWHLSNCSAVLRTSPSPTACLRGYWSSRIGERGGSRGLGGEGMIWWGGGVMQWGWGGRGEGEGWRVMVCVRETDKTYNHNQNTSHIHTNCSQA